MESFGPVETMHSMFILLWTKQTNVDLASGSDFSTANASVLLVFFEQFCETILHTFMQVWSQRARIVPTNTHRSSYMFSTLQFCFESPCCIWGPHSCAPRMRRHAKEVCS